MNQDEIITYTVNVKQGRKIVFSEKHDFPIADLTNENSMHRRIMNMHLAFECAKTINNEIAPALNMKKKFRVICDRSDSFMNFIIECEPVNQEHQMEETA